MKYHSLSSMCDLYFSSCSWKCWLIRLLHSFLEKSTLSSILKFILKAVLWSHKFLVPWMPHLSAWLCSALWWPAVSSYVGVTHVARPDHSIFFHTSLSAPIDSALWSLEHVKAGRKDSQMRTWQGWSRCWCEENVGVPLIPHHTASGWRLDWSCLFWSEWWLPLTASLPQTRRYTKDLTCIHSIFLITAITSILQTRTCLRSQS